MQDFALRPSDGAAEYPIFAGAFPRGVKLQGWKKVLHHQQKLSTTQQWRNRFGEPRTFFVYQ
jgi:hypothetical protein